MQDFSRCKDFTHMDSKGRLSRDVVSAFPFNWAPQLNS
jgi:hypothetical protein